MTATEALDLAAKGFAVFPCKPDKRPYTTNGFRDASTAPDAITRWWEEHPDALIGVALPEGTVVVDIDYDLSDPEATKPLRDADPDFLADTWGQATQSNGAHLFYRANGREPRQSTKWRGLDVDTRVGGKGYVIAWEPDRWRPVDEWGMAPDWVYESDTRAAPADNASVDVMYTREDITTELGRIAAKNLNLPASAYRAMLTTWRDEGRIVALDPKRPWTDADLRKLAEEAAKWEGKEPDWWSEYGITQATHTVAADTLARVLDDLVQLGRRVAGDVLRTGRRVILTAAQGITMRRVKWLWDGRIALGTLSLLGGREGLGKSLYALLLAADVTKGVLPGEHHGKPRNVIVVATEDAWDFTIVPRLVANGADLSRVFRAEAITSEDVPVPMSLPHDLVAFEQQIIENDVALVVFDPLISRLDASLDSHKDAEVRRALEPLVAIAGRTGASFFGLIHVNKTATTDPLTALMASRAFPAVARSVLFIAKDPEEDGVRLLGQPKNSLGREDWPTMRFRVESATVGYDPDDGKPITSGRIVWLEETERTIEDALAVLTQPRKTVSKASEAATWLVNYLNGLPGDTPGRAPRATVVSAAAATGISEASLRRARETLGIEVTNEGFPRVTYWALPARLLRVEKAE